MNSDFISQQDRILVAAIEIISDGGLASLTLENLAIRGNIHEAVVYKYFGGIDEILVAVVDFFIKFDSSIMKTVASKDSTYREKILGFFDAFATYYCNYKEISAIVLHYEELLHNVNTRDLIVKCIEDRSNFLTDLVQKGIDNNEFPSDIDAKEFADVMISIMNGLILNRRVMNYESTLKEELLQVIEYTLNSVAAK